MRLKKLTMQAFGPFKDKIEIDFENNKIDKGLLLITGDTGAGKTTIFDAICFALYGKASGDTREVKSLRSDFANEKIETFVEFVFEHKGKTYTIKRSPEYDVLKKNGEGKRSKPSSVEFVTDGEKLGKTTEVNKAVEELIGLDLKQFHQVAMLSQGEFTKFLLATSDEKTSIFRKIFSTDIFNRISEKLFFKYKSKEDKCKELLGYIEEQKKQIEDIDFSNMTDSELLLSLKEKLNEDVSEIEKVEKERIELNKKITDKTSKITEIEKINEKIVLLEESKKSLENLKEENKNIEEDKKLLEYNTNISSKITNNLNLLESQNKILEENNLKLKNAKERKEETKQILDSKKEIFSSLDNYSNKVKEFTDKLKETENIISKYEQKQILISNIEDNKINIKNAIEKYEEENLKLLDMEKSYYLNESYVLACDLKENIPCPVCGSKNHPCIATKPDGTCTQEELNKQKNILKESLDLKNKVQGDTEVLNKQIEELKLDKDINIDKLKETKDSLEEDLNNLKEDYDRLLEEQKDLNLKLETANSEINFCEENIKSAQEEIKKLDSKLKEIYIENNTNLEEYNENKLEDDEFKNLSEKVKNYDNEFAKFNTQIELLSKDTKGKEIKDVTLEKEKLEELNLNYNDLDSKYISMNSKIEILKLTLKNLENYISDYDKLSKELIILKGLSDTANGSIKGKAKITFENFVQAYYLKSVLIEANKRLGKMTDGRYELRKKEEPGNKNKKTGLDFTVFDAYTGKERDVSSLSGGEKFKASLSLALGLSDVISMFAGGIKIDMLFVDEGFGSLDTESLNQALNTLSNLVDGDKFVGIISHVSELISRIDNKVMVKKNSDGSYIEIEA